MHPTIQRLKKPALVGVVLLAALLSFAWLALPGIVQSRAEAFFAAQGGHRLTLARPEINPLDLSVRLRDLRLDDPSGNLLLGFRELYVDLSAASLTQRAAVFDAILLDGFDARVLQQKVGFNWAPLLATLQGPAAEPAPGAGEKPGLPRIDIHHLQIKGARIEAGDQRTTPPFSTRIEPLDIELTEVSTLPNDQGHFSLSAHTMFGAQIEWSGDVTLNPMASNGQLEVRNIDLSRLAPLLRGKLPLQAPEGMANLKAAYRFTLVESKPQVHLEQIGIRLNNLALQTRAAPGSPRITIDGIELKDGRFDLASQQFAFAGIDVAGTRLNDGKRTTPASLQKLAVGAATVDLAGQKAAVESVTLTGGHLTAQRDAHGGIDLLTTVQGMIPPPSPEPSPPWRFTLGRFGLSGLNVDLTDDGQGLALGLENIALESTGISDNLKSALPLKASLNVKSGGQLELVGKLVPADAVVDLQLKLNDLALLPVQPVIQRFAALDLASGKVSAEGRAYHGPKQSGYKGSFAVNALRLNEAGTATAFLGWKSLATKELHASPERLDIGLLTLDGLNTRILIAKDKSTNLGRILRQQAADTPPPTTNAVPPAPTSAAGAAGAAGATAPHPAPAQGYEVNIDRLRLRDGELEFSDQSLVLRFGTRIHRLRGSISGLSTRPGARGELELDGEVDEYGLARAVGQINLFDPTEFMDLKVVFRNVEMNGLTPYSATFAGRKIENGKLSLDLEYTIKQRQLQGENQLVIDRLELGERIESPTAMDLPLDLAIAILRDAEGRIDLGLPIAGSLDDPQFSYGKIVWKAITNVLSKIVTAPFRALGSLFGGGNEATGNVAFEPGAARLTPPEREKLVRIASVLNKRPGLALNLAGTWAEADRVAMQERQLRRTVAARAGLDTGERGDPGPLSTRAPKVQAALESLYGDRFGSAELAALKEGFRRANPGQLEEGMGGKMMSRLTGLMREKRSLSATEVEQLAGADFYGVLFDRLRVKENITDEALQTLAARRSDAAIEALKAAGAPESRVRAGAPGRVESEGREILLKLELGKSER